MSDDNVIDFRAMRAEAGRGTKKLIVDDADGVEHTFELPAVTTIADALEYHEKNQAREEGTLVYELLASTLFGERAAEALRVFTTDELFEIGRLQGLLAGESSGSAKPSDPTGETSSSISNESSA